MSNTKALARGLTAAAVFALVAAGCGGGGGAAAPPDRSSSELVDELVFGYDSEASHAVREESMGECMALSGFEYEPVLYDSGDATIADTLASLEFREEYGYGISIETDVFTTETEADLDSDHAAYLATLSPAEITAYDEQLTVCAESAEADLVSRREQLLETLPDEGRVALESVADGSDEIMLEIEDRWIDCMAALGHDRGGPLEVFEFLTLELERVRSTSSSDDDEQLRELERDLAVADFECSQELRPAIDERLAEIERMVSEATAGSTSGSA